MSVVDTDFDTKQGQTTMSSNIRVTVIPSGSLIVDEATVRSDCKKPLFPNLAKLRIGRSRQKMLQLPLAAYLIEHPKGKILFDTAFHKQVRTNPVRELTWIHNRVNKPVQAPGEAVDERLEAIGVKPADLKHVVLSHLHTDHSSGLRQFTDAENLWVSKTELDYAKTRKLEYVPRMWEGTGLKTFNFSPSQFGPAKRSFDLFGDGSVLLVNTPGHTPGLAAMLIHNHEGKFVLLTADSAYSRDSWENENLPGIMQDVESTRQTLKWVKMMATDMNCVACHAMHDVHMSQNGVFTL